MVLLLVYAVCSLLVVSVICKAGQMQGLAWAALLSVGVCIGMRV